MSVALSKVRNHTMEVARSMRTFNRAFDRLFAAIRAAEAEHDADTVSREIAGACRGHPDLEELMAHLMKRLQEMQRADQG